MSHQLQCGEKNVKVSKQFIIMYTLNFMEKQGSICIWIWKQLHYK